MPPTDYLIVLAFVICLAWVPTVPSGQDSLGIQIALCAWLTSLGAHPHPLRVSAQASVLSTLPGIALSG